MVQIENNYVHKVKEKNERLIKLNTSTYNNNQCSGMIHLLNYPKLQQQQQKGDWLMIRVGLSVSIAVIINLSMLELSYQFQNRYADS